MNRIHDFTAGRPPEDFSDTCANEPLYKDFAPQKLNAQHADHHCLLRDETGQVLARCSLWWNKVPAYHKYRVGLIGHFAAAGADAALQILSHAEQLLAARSCDYVIAPIDGSTWHHYRLVIEAGDEPVFFLEPHNPADWPQYFRRAGFDILSSYFSALATDPGSTDPRIAPALRRLQDRGIRLRTLRLECFDTELESIYEISIRSFSANFLYTPISRQEFMQQYQAVRPCVRPELTLIAEHEGRPAGFVFALPDLNQATRADHGRTIDTAIIKTVAVLPGRRYAGLGRVLVAEAQRRAALAGYKRVIHALMHEDNVSRNISRHYARPMRRYALFGKELTPGSGQGT